MHGEFQAKYICYRVVENVEQSTTQNQKWWQIVFMHYAYQLSWLFFS